MTHIVVPIGKQPVVLPMFFRKSIELDPLFPIEVLEVLQETSIYEH